MVKKDVLIINPKGFIAICTLWSRKEQVLRLIPEVYRGKVWGIGTLYSVYGINYLIHTLAWNPQISYLVLYGSDLGGAGEALVELFRGGKPPALKLMWSLDEVREVLKGVEVVDLREEYVKGYKNSLVEFLAKAEPRGVRAKVELELMEARVNGWPLPVSGVTISETSIFAAWVKVLYAVLRYGYLKWSEYGEKQKELLNVVVALNVLGSPVEYEKLFQYVPEEVFKKHVDSLFSGKKERGVEYTYGERLRKHSLGGDQIRYIVEKLRANSSTRRAIAVTWYHAVDMESENPPCIVLIQGCVMGDYYNHTVFIRSNDMYAGWPVNVYGQVRLAEHIASQLGLKVGVVTTISSSAHIYEHDWERAKKVVGENEWVFKRFVPDPRGNFLFNGDVVEHRAPTGELVERIELGGDKYLKLKKRAMLLQPDHAFWLGARAYSEEEV